MIRSCRISYSGVDEFVRGNQWLSAVGLAKLAMRLGCDLDAFVALSTRDGETLPPEIARQLPRYRHPFTSARIAAGLSVKDLAATSGVCVDVIADFERGASITPGTGQRLCAVFSDNAAVTASVLAQVVLHPHAAETPLARLFGEICASRKLSLRAAARELSMTGTGLAYMMSGATRMPRVSSLARLALFMGLTERDLAEMFADQYTPCGARAGWRAKRPARGLARRSQARPCWPVGRDAECTMPTLWIHGGLIPPCPFCGAPTEDQNRRPDGADRAYWFCLICQRGRQPDPVWDDPLVPISLKDWRALCRVMSARVRDRWRVTGR